MSNASNIVNILSRDGSEWVLEGCELDRFSFQDHCVVAGICQPDVALELYDHLAQNEPLHRFDELNPLGHGIESITCQDVDFEVASHFYIEYVNMGDPYVQTVMEAHLGYGDRVYYCGPLGDLLEFLETLSVTAELGDRDDW